MNRVKLLLANPHTSGAALGYIGALALAQIGAIWFPTHAGQFQDTADAIKALAVTYGLLAAGDAGKGSPNGVSGASVDRKPDAPAPPTP